jgi:predicted RNA-binding Zn-ribbon protein involved in translation (DUF1610 family)
MTFATFSYKIYVMEDTDLQLEETEEFSEESTLKFKCPVCGELEQNDVIFLCNTCKQEDLIEKEGVYMCPSCLTPGQNFECFSCGSKEVELVSE